MNPLQMTAGDFVLDNAAKLWLEHHKESLARLRTNPELVENLYKELDNLYRLAQEVIL